MDDLNDLIDILNEIQADNINFIENTDDFNETIFDLMCDFVDKNPTIVSDPDFEEILIEEVLELIEIQFENDIFFDDDEVEKCIEDVLDVFYKFIMPPRSFPDTLIIQKPEINKIKKQMNHLKKLYQPEQRTDEWYNYRHNLITASNAYKAFENSTTRNQLIYEKCEPIIKKDENINEFVNVDSPLHWGQKYEPLSVMLYEYLYNTKVEEYGCIQHHKYKFLGASPDGINCDVNSDRYGRMLEIKNIVNREITGIPKTEYWIQTQLQMETCDLNECDFLETKFMEYNNENEFNDDNNTTFKGIIHYFSYNNKPIYKYSPLNLYKSKKEYDIWETQMLSTIPENACWIKNIFWKLENISCVLILRNEKWFNDNISTLIEIWNIIEKERIHGHKHREPVKKNKKYIEPKVNKCLININKDTGKTNIINNLEINI